MLYIEFFLNVILALIALYAQEEKMPKRSAIMALWNSFPKMVRICVLIVLAVSPCTFGLINGCQAQKAHEADEVKIEQLQASVDKSNDAHCKTLGMLDAATNTIEQQTRKLDAATNTIEQQARKIEERQRTIDSIACNTQATLEGKRRFIRSFRDLSRYTKISPDGNIFEGLICDDGVAMYWFRKDTEQMTGFHFFSEAELIRILSGLPNDTITLAGEGTLHIDSQSQLAIALNDSILKQTPSYTSNPIEQDKALESVVEEMKVVLRYVYRARSIQLQLASSTSSSPQRPNGVSISFKYLVDPFAPEPVEGAVSFPNFIFKGEFLQGLCGIDKATLSSRVIEEARHMGVEPKVKIRDIQNLNRIYERRANLRNSPFDNARTEGK